MAARFPRLLRPGNAQEWLQQEFPSGLPQPVEDRVDSTKLQNGYHNSTDRGYNPSYPIKFVLSEFWSQPSVLQPSTLGSVSAKAICYAKIIE